MDDEGGADGVAGGRLVLVAVVATIFIVGVLVAMLVVPSVRSHTDVAHAYLLALRAGDASQAGDLRCNEVVPDGEAVFWNRTQSERFTSVEVSSGGDGSEGVMSGSYVGEDGARRALTVRTRRTGDGPICVVEVSWER